VSVIRSRRLGAAHLASADTGYTVFTVSPNDVAIVRDVFVHTGAPAATVYVYAIVSGDPVYYYLIAGEVTSSGPYHWQGDVVLHGGDEFGAQTSVAGARIYISGALLLGAPAASSLPA